MCEKCGKSSACLAPEIGSLHIGPAISIRISFRYFALIVSAQRFVWKNARSSVPSYENW